MELKGYLNRLACAGAASAVGSTLLVGGATSAQAAPIGLALSRGGLSRG